MSLEIELVFKYIIERLINKRIYDRKAEERKTRMKSPGKSIFLVNNSFVHLLDESIFKLLFLRLEVIEILMFKELKVSPKVN